MDSIFSFTQDWNGRIPVSLSNGPYTPVTAWKFIKTTVCFTIWSVGVKGANLQVSTDKIYNDTPANEWATAIFL